MNVIQNIVIIIINSLLCFNDGELYEIDKYLSMLNNTSIQNRTSAVATLINMYPVVENLDATRIKSALSNLLKEEADQWWDSLSNAVNLGLPLEPRGEAYGEYLSILNRFADSLAEPIFIAPFLKLTTGCCNYHKTLFLYPDPTIKNVFHNLYLLDKMRKKLQTSNTKKEDKIFVEGCCVEHTRGLVGLLTEFMRMAARDEYIITEENKARIKETALQLLNDDGWILRKAAIQLLYYFADDLTVYEKIKRVKNNDLYNYKTEKGTIYPVREAAVEVIKELESQNIEEEEKEIKKDEE